jgi:hypothetical protein
MWSAVPSRTYELLLSRKWVVVVLIVILNVQDIKFSYRFLWRALSYGGCNAVYSVESIPAFRWNIPPPSSVSKMKSNEKPAWKQETGRTVGLTEFRITQEAEALLINCVHSALLIGLSFHPEDGGDVFLRNVGSLPPDYTVLYHMGNSGLRSWSSELRQILSIVISAYITLDCCCCRQVTQYYTFKLLKYYYNLIICPGA